MPDTYTKEQIDKARETLKKCIEIEGQYETGPYRCKQATLGGYVYVSKGVFTVSLTTERDIILSALSTAEQERDAWRKLCRNLHDAVLDDAEKWSKRALAFESERDALKARCAELEARMQSAGWISVEERLPDKETESCSVDCIICEEDGYQTLAYQYYGKLNEDNDNVWYDRVCRRNITGTVTHWMPLPEPPAIVGKNGG